MVRISESQYQQLIGNYIKENKYHNKKVIYDGIKFDSIKEKSFYIKYKLLEKTGEIKDLQRQVEFILIDPFELNGKKYRKTSYVADFVYYDKDMNCHVIDIKSEVTKTQLYKLKKKLMALKYSIEIEEM